MSINGTTNYMSNASILAWMESRTDDIYGKMRHSMDATNARAEAEDALNTLKGQINDLKTNGGDTAQVQQSIQETLQKYKDIPEVVALLQPFADAFAAKNKVMLDAQSQLQNFHIDPFKPQIAIQMLNEAAAPVRLSDGEIENWSKECGDKVDVLSKQDQLGMVNIQEFNAQLNQAKQTASALMDAADKSASAIINHIS